MTVSVAIGKSTYLYVVALEGRQRRLWRRRDDHDLAAGRLRAHLDPVLCYLPLCADAVHHARHHVHSTWAARGRKDRRKVREEQKST